MTRNHSNYLPQEIVIKIMHMLPFASILECKRVSKEWHGLIKDPKFYNLYHDNSLTLFLSRGSLYCVLIREDGNKLSTNPPGTVHRIPIEGSDAELLVSEPSNAVACVGLSNNYLLFFNLFTGTSYRRVDSSYRPVWFSIGWMFYGFGYDHYADDYKIMVVFDYDSREWLMKKDKKFDINTVQRKDNSQIWVYSFRNHAWKAHLGFPYAAALLYSYLVYTPLACSFNGVLHWAFQKRRGDTVVIFTYDLHTSRFGELPEVPAGKGIWATSLSELGGQLCCSIRDSYGLHLWAMKEMEEYGVKFYWTKLFCIVPSSLYTGNKMSTKFGLYESGDGRKIVFFVGLYKEELIWYDIEHDSTQVVEYDESWKVKKDVNETNIVNSRCSKVARLC